MSQDLCILGVSFRFFFQPSAKRRPCILASHFASRVVDGGTALLDLEVISVGSLLCSLCNLKHRFTLDRVERAPFGFITNDALI